MLSASGLERALACESSVVLPQVNTSTEPAARGTSIHAFVRRVLAGVSKEKALAHVEVEHRPTCELIDFRKLGSDLTDVRAEVAYAYDARTRAVRVVGVNIGRNYGPMGPSEIAGTNDFEGTRFDGVPVVADVKTGMPVTACAENPQMKFHALVRMIATGAQEVEARILYVREGGDVYADCYTFDLFELESFGDELAELLGRVESAFAQYAEKGHARLSTGDHCRYCGALVSCPAYVSLARTMATDLEDIGARIAALSPEEAGVAWEKAKRIEKLLENVLDGMKAYAIQNTIPLPNGQTVKSVTFERNDFSRNEALVMLRKKGATDAEVGSLYVPHEVEQVRTVGKKAKRAA